MGDPKNDPLPIRTQHMRGFSIIMVRKAPCASEDLRKNRGRALAALPPYTIFATSGRERGNYIIPRNKTHMRRNF